MKLRAQIRDELNKNRLLGSIPRPPLRCSERIFTVIMHRPIQWAIVPPSPSLTVDTIHLRLDHFETDAGWTIAKVFVTMEPLERLMWIWDFLLPGETEEQAYQRRRCYW